MATDVTPQAEDGFLRLEQIIGTAKAVTNTAKRPLKRERKITYPALIPVSRGTWLAGVKNGRYPPAVKLSPRVVVWRRRDVMALINKQDGGGDE